VKGCKVTYIYDDETRISASDSAVRWFLDYVMRMVEHKFVVIRISSIPASSIRQALSERCLKLIELNSIWYARGEMNSDTRSRYDKKIRKQISNLYQKSLLITDQLKNLSLDFVFMPGGIWGGSGVWFEAFTNMNVRIATYDCGGYKTTMICSDGLACQLQDIPDAFDRLIKGDKRNLNDCFEIAKKEIEKRRSGRDRFQSQISADIEKNQVSYEDSVLIALNSSWDGAVLGVHDVFDSNQAWIIETVQWLLANTDSNILVRQHPAERLAIGATSDDYKLLLESNFGVNDRLKFISANDDVNSYQLIKSVKFIVVATTTFGIEAAALGAQVLTPAKAYFADLGFVHRAKTKEDYYDILFKLSRNSEVQSMNVISAYLCFYLTQCCNWVYADIFPEDVEPWLRNFNVAALESDRAMQNALASIKDGVPVAYLNHLDLAGSQNMPI
jgi:hypothetical protein